MNIELTDRIELMDAKRMEHIIKLANIRKQPLHKEHPPENRHKDKEKL
ncbi:hypothetical protein MTBBW1_410002 [Desulfamplus magnetovallimortis]|uniref:Uncharacterized protein n=1 Tax=Desulfamplus magnetovallimortis TaxID=1246637 RepID=A0A1W1HGM7_9BACT|nr:hypothetical protein [Desulfamplus magnetovallimortis]SLM31647.1 hypothetical protein MTBBW1_410002 [Desulfamplus magnetovallimortis]